MNIDPEMIQKMAKEIASEHMDKFTNPAAGNRPPQPPQERKFPTQEQAKLTRENMQEVFEKAQTLTCDKCTNHVFASVVVVKRISPIISPTGEEAVIPLQTYQCTECGNINEQFLPRSALSDIYDKASKPKKSKSSKSK